MERKVPASTLARLAARASLVAREYVGVSTPPMLPCPTAASMVLALSQEGGEARPWQAELDAEMLELSSSISAGSEYAAGMTLGQLVHAVGAAWTRAAERHDWRERFRHLAPEMQEGTPLPLERGARTGYTLGAAEGGSQCTVDLVGAIDPGYARIEGPMESAWADDPAVILAGMTAGQIEGTPAGVLAEDVRSGKLPLRVSDPEWEQWQIHRELPLVKISADAETRAAYAARGIKPTQLYARVADAGRAASTMLAVARCEISGLAGITVDRSIAAAVDTALVDALLKQRVD